MFRNWLTDCATPRISSSLVFAAAALPSAVFARASAAAAAAAPSFTSSLNATPAARCISAWAANSRLLLPKVSRPCARSITCPFSSTTCPSSCCTRWICRSSSPAASFSRDCRSSACCACIIRSRSSVLVASSSAWMARADPASSAAASDVRSRAVTSSNSSLMVRNLSRTMASTSLACLRDCRSIENSASATLLCSEAHSARRVSRSAVSSVARAAEAVSSSSRRVSSICVARVALCSEVIWCSAASARVTAAASPLRAASLFSSSAARTAATARRESAAASRLHWRSCTAPWAQGMGAEGVAIVDTTFKS
mmetsp:Transcript_10532/g.25822  ORF Transcript_10532/g.25822 Transcript_10532/m.25822 type:complete len:312 (+) Transcript_10532:1443-2378(+)